MAHRIQVAAISFALWMGFCFPALAAEESPYVDVLVSGGTPAGIAAAIGAASDGCSVLLVEPTQRIGGLVTSGWSHTDFHSRESLSGAFLDFARRVEKHYATKYGADSQQFKDCIGGTFAEPKVNLLIFEQMLNEHPEIKVLRNHQLNSLDAGEAEDGVSSSSSAIRSIRSVTVKDEHGMLQRIHCRIAIDASYEGDLMAMAGVPWRVGREGRDEYHESLAPEVSDQQLQGFEDTSHLPPQLYMRQARRMVGMHVYVQRDSEYAANDTRAMLHLGSIAMADYGNNCHGTFHEGPGFGGKHTGELYNPEPPYQIPYGVLVPRNVNNLLVPTAVSSSHVGFCALRLEPIWMSLGQAAGHAAAQAVERGVAVQNVAIRPLQHRLLTVGSSLIYVSDLLPGQPDFIAVQWWGIHGGLHGLAPMPAKPGQRGRNLHGQYFEANPGHAVELDAVLDEKTGGRWKAIAILAGLGAATVPQMTEGMTRGEFIRDAFTAAEKSGMLSSHASVPRLNPMALANIHPPGEVDCIDLVQKVVVDAMSLPGIVVDDSEATLVGAWQYSTHTPPFLGRGYLHDMNAGKGEKSATFTPVIPTDGEYEVRVSHCYNIRRATNAVVTVKHADGETRMQIDQQQTPEHGGLFRTIGCYRFSAGQSGWVRISNEGSDEKYVIADAVQFLPVP